MASSEDTLRSPASCRPWGSVITRSSGESIPLFMHVGVVRMRPSPRRTDKFPSQATMKPRSYIQRPATQMSLACCSSFFAWPGKTGSGVMRSGFLPGAEKRPRPTFLIPLDSGTPRWDLRNGSAGSLELAWRKEPITKPTKNPVPPFYQIPLSKGRRSG